MNSEDKIKSINTRLEEIESEKGQLEAEKDMCEDQLAEEKGKSVIGKCFRFETVIDKRPPINAVADVFLIKVLSVEDSPTDARDRVYRDAPETQKVLVVEQFNYWEYKGHRFRMAPHTPRYPVDGILGDYQWTEIPCEIYDMTIKDHIDIEESDRMSEKWFKESGYTEYSDNWHKENDKKPEGKKVANVS